MEVSNGGGSLHGRFDFETTKIEILISRKKKFKETSISEG